MAMIAVEMVLQKLALLADEETQLLGGVPGGIEELRDDLDSMKAFLQDAEARSETDQGVKTWVKQVRAVAYDAEDVLEEFMIRLTPSPGHGAFHSVRNCYRYIKQLSTRHRLAVQMQRIKVRVKAISERRNAFSFSRVDTAISSQDSRICVTLHDPHLASLYIDEADVVGIENSKGILFSWLLEGEPELTSISVVGMGGLGKTTLVKKVYDSSLIKRCFDCYCWVTVSKSFTTMELLRAALRGFVEATKEPVPDAIDSMGDIQLVDTLRNHLQKKRYIIVFDDVWSKNAWEAVKYAFPLCNSGSRIIFTTRLIDLAAFVECSGHVYHLQPLPEKEAWDLFCMKAFRGENKGVCPKELEEMSRSILKKCGGLPLAIVTIGSLLWKKDKVVFEWKKVLDSLPAQLENDDNLRCLWRILLLSYNDLPQNLRSCYLYLSVFPEDYLIKRMKMIRLWVVERFVEEKQGFTPEEVAEGYLNELVSRSMIQVVEMDYFNRVRTCRVHDIMRELIQLKSKEESFVMIADDGITQNEKVRRMSIHKDGRELSSDGRFPYLRSLLLFIPMGSAPSLRPDFFHGFRLLRVLELECSPFSKFPPELVELIHLRYLSLRKTRIMDLPESIRKLKNLEILDLKSTLVSSLPNGILLLKRLCQLRNYRYRWGSSIYFPDTDGMRVPNGFGSLTSLQKLGSVEVNDNGETVRELGRLTQLIRLGILKLREEHGMDLCYSLEKLKHLTSLYLVSIDASECLQLNSLSSPPQFLQRLYLKCGLPSLPKWIASLQYLSKLVLQYSNLKDDPLRALQELPSLVMLELRQAYDGEELCCTAGGYPRLKMLALYNLGQLKCIRVEGGAMPELRRLDITACVELEMVPLGVDHLKNLQDMMLWDMTSQFINRIKPPGGEDFWKVQHIRSITRVYERRGRWVSETLA